MLRGQSSGVFMHITTDAILVVLGFWYLLEVPDLDLHRYASHLSRPLHCDIVVNEQSFRVSSDDTTHGALRGCRTEGQARKNANLGGRLFPHVNTTYTIFCTKLIYNLTTLCLSGTVLCVDFMDVIMGDILKCWITFQWGQW